jgi:hypothetical protein
MALYGEGATGIKSINFVMKPQYGLDTRRAGACEVEKVFPLRFQPFIKVFANESS